MTIHHLIHFNAWLYVLQISTVDLSSLIQWLLWILPPTLWARNLHHWSVAPSIQWLSHHPITKYLGQSPPLINRAWSNGYHEISREFLRGRYPLESTWEKWFSRAMCHSLRLIAQNLEIHLTTLGVCKKLLTTYETCSIILHIFYPFVAMWLDVIHPSIHFITAIISPLFTSR